MGQEGETTDVAKQKTDVTSLMLRNRHQEKPDGCQFCERQIELTFHHLIPRKVHRRPFFRKGFSKAQLQEGVWLCRLCHKALHKQFDEMTLAKQLNNLEALLSNPILIKHIEWASKQRVAVKG